MEPTRKAEVISWLAFAGAIASLAFGFLPVEAGRCAELPISTNMKCWIAFTMLWLPLAAFASWRYRTVAAQLAFWILFLLGAAIVYGTILKSARLGDLS